MGCCCSRPKVVVEAAEQATEDAVVARPIPPTVQPVWADSFSLINETVANPAVKLVALSITANSLTRRQWPLSPQLLDSQDSISLVDGRFKNIDSFQVHNLSLQLSSILYDVTFVGNQLESSTIRL